MKTSPLSFWEAAFFRWGLNGWMYEKINFDGT